jgi:hypothetical protein
MSHSALISGSIAHRVLNCTGSQDLIARVGAPDETSPYAMEGTLLHERIARLAVDPDDRDATRDLDDEQFAAINGALGALDDLIDDLGDLGLFHVEHPVSWREVLPGTDAGGTVDVLARIGDYNVVLDWKFGRGVKVSARDNHQLLFYAAGALLSWKHFDPDLPTVLAIVQPRVSDEPDVWIVNTERLNDFIDDVLDALEAEPTLARGPWCRWCRAKHACPEWVREANAPRKPPADEPELGNLLELADGLEAWIAALRQEAERRLQAGTPVQGWKLVAKRGTRRWTDEATVRKWAKKARLKIVDIEERKLKSPAQMEKLCKDTGILPASLAPLITSESTGTTIARESDRRPAINLHVGLDV